MIEKKNIVAYFICWNEPEYIKLFHGHYKKFCSKIIMYDNNSTDNSREVAASLGIEVRLFGHDKLDDEEYLKVKNNCWKEQRGKGVDYVIVCDVDEFILLPENLTCSFPKVKGYDMVSETMPEKSVLEITSGVENNDYSKRVIFSPDKIHEINFAHGCHKNYSTGIKESFENEKCLLLHYRRIGGVNRMIERHKVYQKRMCERNLNYKWGGHYFLSNDIEAKTKEWNDIKNMCVDVKELETNFNFNF